MKRIIDERGTGKTTKLIRYTIENDAVLVVPNYRSMEYVYGLMERLGIHKGRLRMTTWQGFLHGDCKGKKVVIDELEWCLEYSGNVIGYSVSTEEQKCETQEL